MDHNWIGYYASRLGDADRFLRSHGYPHLTEAQRRLIIHQFERQAGDHPSPQLFADVFFSYRPDLDKPELRRDLGLDRSPHRKLPT